MKYYWLIFLFIVLPFRQSTAQQQLSRSEMLMLNQNTATATAGRNKQFVFYTVANNLPDNQRNISFKYVFDYQLFACSSGYGTTIISLIFSKAATEAPVFYRDFDISQFIFPDLLEGQFRLVDSKNQKWSKSFSINSLILPNQEIILGQIELPLSTIQLQDVTIDRFNFSNTLVSRLEEIVIEINSYKASFQLTSQISRSIEQQGANDEDDILSLFVNWDISRKALNVALPYTKQDFKARYHIQNEEFVEAYETLKRLNTRLATLLEAKSKDLQIVADNRHLLADIYLASLDEFRNRSKQGDFRDTETYLAIANIQADNALAERFELFETEQSVGQLRKQVYDLLTAKSDELVYKGDHATAISILESLNEHAFFQLNREESAILLSKLRKARIGLLQSYFQITGKSLQAKNDEMAESYYRKAKDFFAKGFNSIPDDDVRLEAVGLITAFETRANQLKSQGESAKAVQMFQNAYQASVLFDNKSLAFPINNAIAEAHNLYFNSLISKSKKALSEGNKTDAIVYCDQAIYYASTNPGFIADESEAYALRNKLGQPLFNAAVIAGIDAASAGDNDSALDVLKTAKAMARQQGLNSQTNIDSLQTILAKPIIVRKLRGANSKVWANKLDDAWKIYEDAKNMTDQYHLRLDAEITDEFKRLDQKLIERICLNTTQEYHELLLEAERFGRQQRFTELKNILDTAKVLLNRNRGCNIDDSRLAEIDLAYRQAFSYQDRINKVLDLMYSQGFAAAIGAYMTLDEQIGQFQLDQPGLNHLDLMAFLKQQGNSKMSAIALEYFLQENLPEKGKLVMPLLITQSSNIKSIDELLERAAIQFAISDAKRNPNTDPEQLAISYFGSEKQYKSYVRTYIKKFKSSY